MSSSLYAKKKLEMNDNHLQILSNGRYRSIEHRAVVHPSKERMSRIPDFDRTENLIYLGTKYTSTDKISYIKCYSLFIWQFTTTANLIQVHKIQPLLTIAYKLLTNTSPQTKIKHFSSITISLSYLSCSSWLDSPQFALFSTIRTCCGNLVDSKTDW